ncbi:hypothetical protein B0T26DRAFT_670816 [Lasiosphaeria miniovina]|uniref:Rhodopsin domain-containing protein n=1 Tax=Lasiosphaeria miniovina TaxID=1954250 RepID=A0AA40BHU8_9PEZI|nr:uncharacterized protein B0T26DRAFT_670816 [Lasiosphaeria miniovina]KAK0734529.1 hypothetical protein B0T26DRAFT_670816 [Lasiosphaeria miniovina]
MATSFDWSNFTIDGNNTLPTNSTIAWPPIPDDQRRSLQPDIFVCAILTWLIALAFVVLRFYTRGWLNHVLGPADWFLLPALLFAAGVTASSLEQACRGAGKHYWQVDFWSVPDLEKAAWYGILFYTLSLVFTRISILLLYRRIFTYSWTKKAIQVVLTLVIAIGIWLVASVCTACVPLEAFWNWGLFYTQPVFCQPPNLWWGNAALHIVCDLVIMTLPLPVLSSLKLPRRQKIALIGVFALGFIICIISILRLVTLINVQAQAQQSLDSTYTSAKLIFWTSVEVNASICCACMMTLKPLIQRWFPSLLSSRYARDRSLPWITPLTNRNSRQSFSRPITRHVSHPSGTSGCGSKGSVLPQLEEFEGGHCLGVLKPEDLEAQRTGSISTVACDEEAAGALRAPPKAHLRLSIHVTRSVEVTKVPESPVPVSGDNR